MTTTVLKGYVITLRGRAYSVVAESRRGAPAYQEREWSTTTQADFEFGPSGEVLWQGRPVQAAVHTCNLPRWARE